MSNLLPAVIYQHCTEKQRETGSKIRYIMKREVLFTILVGMFMRVGG